MGSCKKNSSDSLSRDSHPVTVDVAYPVVDSVIIHKSYPGYLTANTSIAVVARVNGYLTGKYFEDGGKVTKGQVLFQIEDTQYRDQLQQAEAQLQTAIASNAYAEKHYEAMKKALLSDAVSQMDVLQAESAMNQSKAAIESARAAVQTARTTLSYCTIKSPITGIAAAPNGTIGDYIGGGGSPYTLTTVYDDDIVNAHFAVDDNQFISIAENMKNDPETYKSIPVQFGDSIKEPFFGELAYIAPNVITGTGTIDMKVNINNENNKLKAGMYALVNLPVAADPEAILVKDASIGTDQLGKYLYTLNDSNRVVYTSIKTGELVNDSMRIVQEGIAPDTRYVTKALLKVRSGMEVDPHVVK
ncbi:MAG: efflux RND transporter periplasmic adaptor subunit [Muribaculaceae bacterium]|nr:efflux RND transporter periplasmic adaptor subunit [Muribaculaceae bacterium]